MGMTPEEFDEVQAAAALGDGDAQHMIDDVGAHDEAVRRRQDELHRTVSALDQLLDAPPPASLRERLLDEAGRRRPATVEPSSAVGDLFAAQVGALRDLLSDLADEEWARPVTPYRWSVHGLVAHLLVIENYTAGQLGLAEPTANEAHHLELGADVIATELRQPPVSTASRWLARAQATATAVLDDRAELPDEITLHGWPFSTEGALVARAFEIWTHADDIRRATRRPLSVPRAGDLRAMSSFSVGALPLTFPLVESDMRLTPTRIVLTGDGGGTFDIGEGAAPHTTLVADVVDYCRVAARRIQPDDLDCTIDGDEELARRLLVSASVFAV